MSEEYPWILRYKLSPPSADRLYVPCLLLLSIVNFLTLGSNNAFDPLDLTVNTDLESVYPIPVLITSTLINLPSLITGLRIAPFPITLVVVIPVACTLISGRE